MDDTQTQPPRALIKPQRRWSLAWIVCIAAVALAAWLAIDAWIARGRIVTVHFTDAHGLAPGAPVRHRGVIVGEVRDVALAADHVNVQLALKPRDAWLASQGARFWIVRPQVAIERVENLETILGAKYVAIDPGDGGPIQSHFVGLHDTPPVLDRHEGDLDIRLLGLQRFGLNRGAAVTYRGVRVGTVLSVGLTSDGSAVEANVHIRQPYVTLIRTNSRFWASTGVKAELGLRGFALEVGSLESLVTGGVSLATPPEEGGVVRTGHVFTLAESPEEEWLEWQPQAAIGSELLPPGAPMPDLLRARLVWEEGRVGRFLRTDRTRSGWLLPTERGLLGPLNLLRVNSDDATEAAIHVIGQSIALATAPNRLSAQLGVLETNLGEPAWPAERMRSATGPENVLIVTDASDPLPIASFRLTPGAAGTWAIDRAAPLDREWHGAAVVARSDGRIIGIVIVPDDGDDPARVALLPESIAGSAGDEADAAAP